MLSAPIKWIEDRVENFTATVLERDQDWDMEAAFDADGRLLAIRGHMRHDHGANTPYGVALPYNAATNMIGPYVLPACDLTERAVQWVTGCASGRAPPLDGGSSTSPTGAAARGLAGHVRIVAARARLPRRCPQLRRVSLARR